MPICRHCGHRYQEGAARYCPNCGQPQEPGAQDMPSSETLPVAEEPERMLWEGEAKDLTNLVSGGWLVSCRYRLTNKALYFDEGLVTTVSQQVPLWAVRDIDIRQRFLQKRRGVADVVVTVQHSEYTGMSTVLVKDVEGALALRDLLNQHAQQERLDYQQRQQTRYFER